MHYKAFTMIELIFVIIILGILGSIAIPKLTEIQNDASSSVERADIGSARTSVVFFHAKYTLTKENYISTCNAMNGATYVCKIMYSPNGYPLSLSVTDNTNSSENNRTTSTTLGDGLAMAVVYFERNSLADWNSTGVNSSGLEFFQGKASNAITDVNADLHTGKFWEYNNANGRIILR